MPDIAFSKLDRSTGERFQWLRRDLGVSAFGLSLGALEPGQRGRVHIHERQEEVYLVLEGELTIIVDRVEHRLGPDDLMRVAPPVKRQVANLGTERTLFIALGGAGEHVSRDALAWGDWDAAETEEGRSPVDVPVPEDLPPDR